MSESNEKQDYTQLPTDSIDHQPKNDESTEFDVVTLPPRRSIHKSKDEKKKTRIKFKYPIIRLLAMLFVLLPIAILGYTYHQNNQAPTSNLTDNESSSSEEISIGKKEDSKEIQDDVGITEDIDIQDETIEEKETNEVVDTPSETDKKGSNSDRVEDEKESSPTIDEGDYDIVFHKVKEGETLYSISQYYYNNRSGEEIIMNQNGLEGNTVEIGKILEIPLKNQKSK